VTVTGHSRNDVAFATGFAHAQDRFFQMDLARRMSSGRLAELVGDAALDTDARQRLHQFRRVAGEVFARLASPERACSNRMHEASTPGSSRSASGLSSTCCSASAPSPGRPTIRCSSSSRCTCS